MPDGAAAGAHVGYSRGKAISSRCTDNPPQLPTLSLTLQLCCAVCPAGCPGSLQAVDGAAARCASAPQTPLSRAGEAAVATQVQERQGAQGLPGRVAGMLTALFAFPAAGKAQEFLARQPCTYAAMLNCVCVSDSAHMLLASVSLYPANSWSGRPAPANQHHPLKVLALPLVCPCRRPVCTG